MFSFTLLVGKIKIKGDFKGSHKKTDRAFNWAMNHITVSYLKKKACYGGKRAQAFLCLGFYWHSRMVFIPA